MTLLAFHVERQMQFVAERDRLFGWRFWKWRNWDRRWLFLGAARNQQGHENCNEKQYPQQIARPNTARRPLFPKCVAA